MAYEITTGFKTIDPNTSNTQDLGSRYITKDYLLDVYPNLASSTGNRTAPGLWGWGTNNRWNLGLNNLGYYSSPVQVGALANWKQVNIGSAFAVAIKTDGTMWSWGWNNTNTAALGQNTILATVYYSSPVQIGALTTWKSIEVAGFKTHAIKTDGTLWAWGDNNRGALGITNIITQYYSSPVQVGALTTWKQMGISSTANAADFSLALRNDGALFAWGDNRFGELGINTVATLYYSSPIQVGALTNWKQAACGGSQTGYFAAAVKTDGTLWSWGANMMGQLGHGTQSATTYYSSPIQVGALTSWKSVVLAGNQCYAIKTDGTLWVWGWNGDSGVLGLNTSSTTLYYSSPVQVGALTNWKYIRCGDRIPSVMAIKTDGTLWTWGSNASGQLGLNNLTYYSSPVQVGTLTTWKSVAIYGSTTMAIQDGYI